ncbi:MAG: hypothetical protein GXP27_01375 [Planctomycetes bacterium]|nr:hypothetical protein [Planctomycetota bacterium]
MDYRLRMPAGSYRVQLAVRSKTTRDATILTEGLSRGGEVSVTVNGKPVRSLELLASGGLEQGRADAVRFRAQLTAGNNRLAITESPGVQIVRVAGSNVWFGTTDKANGHAVFSVDLDLLVQPKVEYPVTVYYGPKREPFCWFSGKFDKYYGDCYAKKITEVSGGTGPVRATLHYTAVDPDRNVVMPTRITLEPAADGTAFSLRVYQTLRATGPPSWSTNLEFLHLVINRRYGHDWGDGVPDFVWYRAQREDAPDTLPGSHTTLVRMDDNSRRRYPFPKSTADATQIGLSGPHHTGAAVAMEAKNTIGGWFTKSGVGCIGLVFHQYKATFRDHLTPLQSHCGDGADTHVYLFWGDLYRPLGMKPGDQIDIEYTLTMLPSEPLLTDIEDINEADLWIFGKEKEQQSTIVGWIGTKRAIGLRRSDGSIILLGIGTEPGRVPVPPETRKKLKRAYLLFDPGRPRFEPVSIQDGTVEVRPRWLTVLDCGSARIEPK